MAPPRLAGVTLPLFSVRTGHDWGIGQITDLPACASWILRAGHRLLQLLPVHELAAGETSPYGARTAFGLDPIYVGIDAVVDLDRAAIDEALGEDGLRALERARTAACVDYAAVRPLKERVLARAFERFLVREWSKDSPRACAFREFVGRQAAWVDDLALYVALRERRGAFGWESWPATERDRAPDAIVRARRDLEARMLRHKYAQWIAFEQWQRAKAEMTGLGVELMGDLPFIIGRESSDVWSHASQFRRDVSLGAPPDAFSDDGQDWGLPAYDWATMDQDDLAWVRARTAHAATLYDRFRLDHVIGYFRMYLREPGHKGRFEPASEDAQSVRGERVLRAMVESAGSARIVAEDLGVVPPFARAALTRLGIPGYRVIPWEKDDRGYRDPKQFPEVSVATWSTHDTPPITAWWEELPAHDREALTRMLRVPNDLSEADRSLALLGALFASSSELTLALVPELLGGRERINMPATVHEKNWTYRLPAPLEDLERDAAAIARMDAVRELVRASAR